MNDDFHIEDGDGAPVSNVAEYSVSEISGQVKRMIEDAFGRVRVRGEIGRVSRPASGHIYLDLKDERAVLAGVIWKGSTARLKHRPEEGLEVIATGKLTTFPGSSKYQIIIEQIEPAGAGALMALLEERKRKLEAEGLFSEARKQLLPYMPNVVGVVTSPSGAVIRDILHRIMDRFPLHVVVWPVRVQGETSGAEVAAAINGFNNIEPGGSIPRPDIIIVARGGGSIEDLWGFNEEAVVRAAAQSHIPLVSAVGHETDWTLIDLAADRRAPTPTGAAEMIVPVRAELEARLAQSAARLRGASSRGIEGLAVKLRAAARGLPSPDGLFALQSQRLDGAASRLQGALQGAVHRRWNAYERIAGGLSHRLLTARMINRRETLSYLGRRAGSALSSGLRDRQGRLERARLSPAALGATLRSEANRLQQVGASLSRLQAQRIETFSGRLQQAGRLLSSYSYHKTLERGFAVVRENGETVVTRRAQVRTGISYEVQFADGRIDMIATGKDERGEQGGGGSPDRKARQEDAGHRPDAQTARKAAGNAKPSSGQGSLFD